MMSVSKIKSMSAFRCEFPSHILLDSCSGFIGKPVDGRVFACPFSLHPLGLPVVASSLSELWDAQGDDRRELEELHPSMKCLERKVRLRHDSERRRDE